MPHQQFFYVNPQEVTKESLVIKGDEFKHLGVVVRKKPGDRAVAVDGQGNVFEFTITRIEKNFAEGRIDKKSRRVGEPLFRLTLGLALLKGQRFDWVIEKGTEIGIARFIPLLTDRGVAEQSPSKINRWRRIALTAMKQSCRSIWPEVTEAQPISQVLNQSSEYALKLMAHPEAGTPKLSQILEEENHKHLRNGIIVIGPEGGFTADEVTTAMECGFSLFSLGPRRLRSETAAMVAATLVLEKLGEL
ncbi:MAG: 16S rRNA (uracil(1498)-N(3))-methyltransferase [candidate division KSB1 bacterium]|nr:16S rRNA (uracil(1498)-N(3))-methyltransferase [candidate division KSB1 bacterium]